MLTETVISGRPPKEVTITEPSPSVVLNKTLTNADTEYSQLLPSNCKKIEIKTRSYNDLKFTFVSGESGTTYQTIQGGATREIVGNLSSKTIYFQSPTAGEIVEILSYV